MTTATDSPTNADSTGEYKGYTGSDDLSGKLLAALAGTIGEYKELNSKLMAAEGDREKALADFIANSDHKDAVRLRKAIENANAKLNELAEANVVTDELPEEEKDKLRTHLGAIKERLKKSRSAIQGVAETMSSDPEGVMAALTELGDPTSSNRGRKPGTTGSSLPRVSANLTITGGNLDNKVVESFSKAAMLFNCEVKDLQLAFAKAAGVAHEDIKTVDKSVTFEFQPNDNGAVYKIVTAPKERQTPGPKKKEDSEVKTEAPAA
jgi:hypothetical protein